MTDQFITFGPHKIRRDLIVAVSIGCTQVLAKKARWFSLDPFYDFKPRIMITVQGSGPLWGPTYETREQAEEERERLLKLVMGSP